MKVVTTVNYEHFIFQIAWLMQKLNAQKYLCIINGNVVQGRLSKNYLFIT